MDTSAGHTQLVAAKVGLERGHRLKKDLKGPWVVPTHGRGSEGDREVDRGVEERGSPRSGLHTHQSLDGGCSRNTKRL